MDLEFVCDRCGTRFTAPNFIGGTATVYMEGNRVRCPVRNCGGWGHHKPGYYEFVNGVVRAFTSPGMTREKVDAARQVAKDASAGAITSEDAIKRLEAISGALANAVERSADRRINWELILTLLMCIYTIWTDQKSDADAQAALTEARTQTELAQRMLEESRAQSGSLRELVTRPALQPPAPTRTNAPRNRAERRKAAAIERRAKNRGE